MAMVDAATDLAEKPVAETSPALRVTACPFCGDALKGVDKEGNCPKCGSHARLRALVPLMKEVVGPLTGAADGLPLLAFALTSAEHEVLAPYYSRFKSVSLYGDYVRGHETGVDARDLSRYPRNAFAGHFSLLLFDYFEEQEKALAEAFRVIAPGGLLITHIASYRLSETGNPPRARQRIYPRKGYFDYLPTGVSLPSADVGIYWFVEAMLRVGFEGRWIQVADPAGPVNWFVGVKPLAGAAAPPRRPAPPVTAVPKPAAPPPAERIATAPVATAAPKNDAAFPYPSRLRTGDCPVCGAPAASFEGDVCPSCSAPARVRTLGAVAREIVAPYMASHGSLGTRPLLAFAMDMIEYRLLERSFPMVQSVSLYGKYFGPDHMAGIDARDLSRFAAGQFSGFFSIALFDYFVEHDKALAEAFRVLAPGGIFFTYIMPYRLAEGDAAPALDHMLRPGHFSYMPPAEQLPSSKVGRSWFVKAMERAGFIAREVVVRDEVTGKDEFWFVGLKPSAGREEAGAPIAARAQPAARPAPPVDDGRSAFDREHGTDTDGDLPLSDFTIDSANLRFAERYQPTYPEAITKTIGAIGIDPAEWTFVDLGCGKGRTLILAAEIGFRAVVGVEFARELADIAASNLKKLRLHNASVWAGDAAEYPFPEGNLVIYMYNPFSAEVLAPILERLRTRKGRLCLIYKNPKYAEVVDAAGYLRRRTDLPGKDPIVWEAEVSAPAKDDLGTVVSRLRLPWIDAAEAPEPGVELAPIRCYSLIEPDERCGPGCAHRVQGWFDSFRDYGDDRCRLTDVAVRAGGSETVLTVHSMPQATIDLFGEADAYEKAIAPRTRTKIRKAERLGYAVAAIRYDDFLDEIFAIRTSTPTRQGRALPEQYFRKPSPSTDADSYCPRHHERTYGVFHDNALIAYCTIRFYGEIASVQEILGHKDFLANDGMMYLLILRVVEDIRSTKPWVRGLNYLYVTGWDGLIDFKKRARFLPRRTIVTRAAPEAAAAVERALAEAPAGTGTDEPAGETPDAGSLLFEGAYIPPFPARGASGFHTILAALGLDRSTRALCIGGGAWIPNNAIAALLDFAYPLTVAEWRRPEFIEAVREKAGGAATILTAPIETLGFGSGFGIVAVDLFASDFLHTVTTDLPLLDKLLAPGGVVICRFIYQLDTGLDDKTWPRYEAEYVRLFGSKRPSVTRIAEAFRRTPFAVRGVVDRLNGSDEALGDGWMVLQRRGETLPARAPAGAAAADPLAAVAASAEIDAEIQPPALGDDPQPFPVPFVHGAEARPQESGFSRTFSTPLDPALGFRRVVMTVQVPDLPPEAVGARFASHAYSTDEQRARRTVYAVHEGGIVVSEDMGRHFEFVSMPQVRNIGLQNVFQTQAGNVLVQGAGPHRPTDPRGHPDLEAPIFVCDRDFRVIDRVQPGKTHWHGPRAIDQAGGVIVYAEYPENAIKYSPDFADDPARHRHLVDDARVLRSGDGGRTWSEVFRKSWKEIRHFHTAVADPYEPGTWYVSSGDQPHECRVWRSTDGAITWHEVTGDASSVPLHPTLRGRHGSVYRHTDMVVLPDRVIWGADDLLGPPRLYRDPDVGFGSRVGSRLFMSTKTGPLDPKPIAFVGSHVRSLIDVGPAYLVLTEAKSLKVTGRPQVCLLFKNEPYQLVELFTVDRFHGSGTGFTFSRHSRAAVDGRFFTYRDSNDMFAGGSRILQWEISFE